MNSTLDPNLARYLAFHARAIEAGCSPELAAAMYDCARDCEQHDWMPCLRDLCSDYDTMIEIAQGDPDLMKEACLLLFSTDGLMYDRGGEEAGFTDARRSEVEKWLHGKNPHLNNPIRPWRL